MQKSPALGSGIRLETDNCLMHVCSATEQPQILTSLVAGHVGIGARGFVAGQAELGPRPHFDHVTE